MKDDIQINDGGPAFPGEQGELQDGSWNQTWNPGMSLRDWFAAQALTTVRAHDLFYGTVGKPVNPWPSVAEDCYRAADAMLAARKENEDE